MILNKEIMDLSVGFDELINCTLISKSNDCISTIYFLQQISMDSVILYQGNWRGIEKKKIGLLINISYLDRKVYMMLSTLPTSKVYKWNPFHP